MRREYTRPSPVLQSLTAVQFTSNRKMPAPCTKNGRCSLKKVSNAVRLSTAGSASTWPKSGLRSEERRVGKEWRSWGSAPDTGKEVEGGSCAGWCTSHRERG